MKVAIIGGGASGLTAMKCCLDGGLQPVCFEHELSIGGMWNFTEAQGTSSVYRSTVINTSKEMMCFSDFPIPKDFPPYMHHTYVIKYLRLYVEHFGLEKYIRLGCKVFSVSRSEDFQATGRWKIESCSRVSSYESHENVVEYFDAVMICTGHHWQPSWPSLKGMEIFEGVQIHSHSYKDFRRFEGKTVLVVGLGNSAGDIAVELSQHARQVYVSTRRGAWVVPRLHESGMPADQYNLTRFLDVLPLVMKKYVSLSACKFSHENLGLLPTHKFYEQHPIINDILPSRIITGSVIIKPDIEYFTRNGVLFKDGTTIEILDFVIFCTGYDIRFPYLDIEAEIVKPGNEVNLYKYVFPPFLEKSTLAVVGNVQPTGAVNPVSELQARWAVQVFSGQRELPAQEVMQRDIQDKWDKIWRTYYFTKRSTIKVDYIRYCDELAEMIGCKPNLLKLFLHNPVLALKCFFGPCTPPQYRLMGPGSWPGAKQAIEMVHNNIVYATKTRLVKPQKSMFDYIDISKVVLLFIIILLVLCALLCAHYFN